jgi:hypothetical protein
MWIDRNQLEDNTSLYDKITTAINAEYKIAGTKIQQH